MNSTVKMALIFLALMALVCGCGDSGTDSDDEGVIIYVDVAAEADGDGTQETPFDAIGDALVAARAGDLINIAAGTYETNETFPLELKPGVIVKGTGAVETVIIGGFLDTAVSDTLPVELHHMSFESLLFGRGEAPAAPSGINLVKKCTIGGDVTINHGGGHHFTIDSSIIQGNIVISHGEGDSKNTVTNSSMGHLTLNNGAGAMVNVIRDNYIDGDIDFSNGAGATDTISGNEISASLDYRSGASEAVISDNEITGGQIYDASGGGEQLITGNSISSTLGREDRDSAAIVAIGMGCTIKNNTITANEVMSGIIAQSGATTVIDSNTITVVGDNYGIYTVSGAGQIVGNIITGGEYGLYDKSGATDVSYNTITSSDIGVYTQGAGRYHHNTITLSLIDGMRLDGVTGPIDSNTVTNNGANGIRIVSGVVDLGGGADGGVGGNVIRNNPAFDLVNGTTGSIKAENNRWTHDTESEIDSNDIKDDDEEGSSGYVDFVPFLVSK